MINKENINGINNLTKEYQSFYNHSILNSIDSTRSNNSSEFSFKKNNMNNINCFNNFNESSGQKIYSKNDITIHESGHFANNKEPKFQKMILKYKSSQNFGETQDNIFVQLFPKYQNYNVNRDKLLKIQRHLLNSKNKENKKNKKIDSRNKTKIGKKMSNNNSMSKIFKNNNLIFSKINNRSFYGKYLRIAGVKSCENFKSNKTSLNNRCLNNDKIKKIPKPRLKKIFVNTKILDNENFKYIYQNKNNYKDNKRGYDANSNSKIKVKVCKSFSNLIRNNALKHTISLGKINNYIF